jgi:hypothetical protein
VQYKKEVPQLHQHLMQFRNDLNKMATAGRLAKFLTNNRLRKKIEEDNMQSTRESIRFIRH